MTGLEIAVIGMAGRFPGAKNIDEFWNNLKNGVESIVFFSDEELEAAGIEPGLTGNPNYVKVNGLLADIEYFDPSFFNYSRKEAEIMDPQIRIFHECAWEALENSGYDPGAYKGLIGLYGGASSGFYWEAAVTLSGKSHIFGFWGLQLMQKDMACPRVSYRLNLQGPVFSLYTGCSTSLVAIHLACQGLLSGECDMALAGAVNISLPQVRGHIYYEGMIASRDGHCRAFDAAAAGTINGNGAAVVVLERLEDALDARDYIYAVIKGSAINNDGNRKIGFTAPSIKGQAEVISAAHKMAEVDPESIGYIETHGTGTILGDPIEIKALARVFNTGKKHSCGIGSVKTNVGHMDAAAGVTGFIKAALALKHRLIPPSLHIKTPNPQLEIENTPFYVVSELTQWKNNKYPLRAGVSSFGVGGTNAHVILEEPPEGTRGLVPLPDKEVPCQGRGGVAPPRQSRQYQLILLSAKTETALDKMTENLAEYLKKNLLNPGNHGNPTNPGPTLADVAYTLQVGRQAFGHRRTAVCSTPGEAVKLLESTPQTSFTKPDNRSAVFMFPGQGAQYVGMGRELYREEPVFRREIDRCLEILKHLVEYDIKEILYPSNRNNRSYKSHINQTEITQPVLFIFEYSLANLLIKWEIKPEAMIGHSIGEYVAACLAGVFSLQDALKIVVLRGKLMQQMPTGTMLGVFLPEEKLTPLLPLNGEVSLAAVNSPSHCVVSGPHKPVKHLSAQLKEKGIENKPLHTSHAFHSKMMEPILNTFANNLKQIKLNKPKIPFISNLTGEIITHEQAVDPGYWVNQLRETVKFSRGINRLLKQENLVYLEVGPGNTLSTFVKKHRYDNKKESQLTVNLVRHPKESVSDTCYLLEKIGQLWHYGVKIDGQAFYAPRERRRIPLPTYSFDRIRCWPGGNFMKPGSKMRFEQDRLFEINDKTDWFYVPSWERSPLTRVRSTSTPAAQSCWLVFIDAAGFGERLVERLKKQDKNVISVHAGEEFTESDSGRYTINPRHGSHYDGLFNRLARRDKTPGAIIHLWGITPNHPGELKVESIENALDTGFNSLIHIARAITGERIPGPIRIGVVTDNLQEVTGEEVLCPGKAAVLATVKIIPLEYPHITCQAIDILVPAPGSRQEDIFMDYLVQEFTSASPGLFIAYRGMHRWTQSYKRVRLDKPPAGESDLSIKEGSVCLVTGEGGDTAIATAGYLLNRLKARVILILPPDDSPGKGRGKPREWEEAGAPIMIANVDNSSRQMMEKVVKKAKKRFGRVNALIHMPGDTAEAGKIQEMSPRMSSAFVAASMKRILVMDQVLKDMDTEPDFVMLFSTIGTAVYPSQVGNVSQCAANDFLDAFSIYKTSGDNTFASTINNWLTPQDLQVEWGDILNSILENKLPRVLVSPVDLKNLVLHYNEYEASIRPQEPGEDSDDKAAVWETVSLQRRGLSTPYKAPDTDTEKSLAKIWQKFFGIDRLGTHDDFFQLGGDSLQAMAIVNNIHHSLHVKVPIDFFFSNSTIRELACYIQSQSKKEARVYWQPVEKKEYYPLTPMQSTILYVNQMDPNSLTYNISFALEMKLNLNKRILTGALAKLIETHEILRTSFENIEGKSLQRVHDYEAIDFDVEYLEPTGNHEESISRITKNFIRPFDLRRAPLLRAALIKITHGGGIKYIMVLDMHHIAADGDSGNIITRGLAALARGEELPRLNIQYKDYAVWYHNQMESGLIKTQEEYWIKQFEKVPPVLNLPTDYQKPVPRSYDGDFLNFEIEEEKSGQLRTLAREDSATLTMVLLCIYSIFLSKLTGQEDIVIAAPFNGRIHNQLLPVIGMLVKTLYFRFYPTREKLFVEFLREVRTRAVEAYENQDYPPDTLANRIGLKRSPGRNPITDAGFSLVKIGETIIDEGPSTPAPHVNPYDLGRSDLVVMDINLIVIEKGNRISFRFAYLTGLFKKETIKRFAQYFKNILDVVLENKNIPLKNIRLSNDLLEAEPNITDVDFDL